MSRVFQYFEKTRTTMLLAESLPLHIINEQCHHETSLYRKLETIKNEVSVFKLGWNH